MAIDFDIDPDRVSALARRFGTVNRNLGAEGLTDDERQFISDLARTGIDIRKISENPNIQPYALGRFMLDDGSIELNPNRGSMTGGYVEGNDFDPAVETISHEVAHSIQPHILGILPYIMAGTRYGQDNVFGPNKDGQSIMADSLKKRFGTDFGPKIREMVTDLGVRRARETEADYLGDALVRRARGIDPSDVGSHDRDTLASGYQMLLDNLLPRKLKGDIIHGDDHKDIDFLEAHNLLTGRKKADEPDMRPHSARPSSTYVNVRQGLSMR